MRKLISLICALSLLATSLFTVNMPITASAAGSELMSFGYDFEGYKGYDDLSLRSLTEYGGTWDAYAFVSGVTGITDVATDRGTSINIINRSGSGKDYVFVRPRFPHPTSKSLRIKFSFNFKDLVRGYAVRLNNNTIIMQNIYNKVTVMGNAFSVAAKTDVWYDFDISVNLKNGYYVASITSEGKKETFEGISTAVMGKTYEFMEMGYYGGKSTLELNNLWLDDLYVEESENFCKSILSENDFESFEGDANGTTVPEGFTATGLSAGVNGLYSEDGKIKVVTGNTTPVTMEKAFPITDKISASTFGTVRIISDINMADSNADRSFLIGTKEIVKFSSDGNVTIGAESASYETGVDYKVSIKLDTAANEADVSVIGADGEVVTGKVTLSASNITKVVFKTVQTGASSVAYIDSFSTYNDNGLELSASAPANGAKNIAPQDIKLTFTNSVKSVDYITFGDESAEYELTDKNQITVLTSSIMNYGKDYELVLSGVTDIFGESKDFTLNYSTIVAMSLGDLVIDSEGDVTAKISGVANDGQDHSYTLVLVQYNAINNMLVDIVTKEFTLEDTSKEFSVSLYNDFGSYYEAYLWDNFTERNVISQKVTYGIEPFPDAKVGNDGFAEDMDTGVMTGSNIGINPEGTSVLVVLKPGKTPDDIASAEKLTDVIDFVKQFDLQENDVISYTPSAGNGIYSYIIDGNYVENAFDYIDPSYVSMVFDELNKEDADFIKCVEDYNRILVCDTTELDTFDDDKKQEVNDIIHDERDAYSSGFETIASFHNAYYKAIANILVKYSEKASDVQTAFEKYGEDYGVKKLSAYNTYAEANNTAKAEVYAAIANADASDKDTFEKVDAIVADTIILAAIRNSQTQAQIGNIIAENNDTVLNLDLSQYNKVTNKSALHTKLIGANVYTIDEFKTLFDKAVAERLKEEEVETDVSAGVVPAGNAFYYDFEGYVGDDASLALTTLQNYGGTWGAYNIGAGVAGPTSVKGDRGTSINLINRDNENKYGSAQVRTYAKTPISTSAEIKFSFKPIEFNVSSVVYFFGEGSPNQFTGVLVRPDDININVMGTILGFKPVVNEWYDVTLKINKASGYYEATLTCGENSQTVTGINETLRKFKTFTGIGIGYSGSKRNNSITQMWIDDISIREIDPFYLTLGDEENFDSFSPNSMGTTVPQGFEAEGIVRNENGFYAQDGALLIKNSADGALDLTKKFNYASKLNASVYGNVRTSFDINLPDTNADRIIKIGTTEVARFGADGKISAGDAAVDYETGKDYNVVVKVSPASLTDDKGETYYNKVTIIVTDESGEVFNATSKIPDGTITGATLSVSKSADAAETLIDNFKVCTDNGFFVESASPFAYETNVVPCDAEFVFSNAVAEIKDVKLNDVSVDYEFTSDKSIKVNIKDLLEYNQKYTITIVGAKDIFGETKEIKHAFYTTFASSLSDIAIKESDNVTASVSGYSHDGNKYSYTLVLASFDSQSGKLINIKKTNFTLDGNKKDFTVSVPKTEGGYYEAYVWDGVKSMTAIKDKATFGTYALADITAGENGYVQNMDTLVLTATNTGIKGSGRNTLLVLKPGKTMNDISLASDLGSVIDYIGQFDNVENDVYAFTPSEGGQYGVAINGVFKSKAFTYISRADIDSVIEKINSDDASFVESIENHNNILKVDTKELEGFDAAQKARLEELITEERAKSEGFESCEEFKNAYDYAISRVVIETAKTGDDVKVALEKYGEGLGMKNFVAYETYEALSDSGKSAIYSDLAKADDLSTVEKIEKAFADATILRAVQYAGNYVDIANIIGDNNDYLGFDVKAYNSLQKQSVVNKALVGNYYSTIAKLESAFESEVSKQKKAESGSNSSGGGSGSGSGSSKGFGNSGLNLGPVVETPVAIAGFTDLGNHEWAREAIEALTSKGIVSGRSKTVFDPGANITREEFTKIIVSAFTTVDTNLECNFADVSKDAWYYSYVATAAKIGLINGTSATTFGTGEKITRQDMATMLYRACMIFGTELEGGALSFADSAQISDYASEAVASLSASGVINGKGNNNFEPSSFATRAESAKMIYETLERGDK